MNRVTLGCNVDPAGDSLIYNEPGQVKRRKSPVAGQVPERELYGHSRVSPVAHSGKFKLCFTAYSQMVILRS